MSCISNYSRPLDAITHPSHNFNGGSAKPPLKLGHRWVIPSYSVTMMWCRGIWPGLRGCYLWRIRWLRAIDGVKPRNEGFDEIFRLGPEVASQTTPKQPSYYSHFNMKLEYSQFIHANLWRTAPAEPSSRAMQCLLSPPPYFNNYNQRYQCYQTKVTNWCLMFLPTIYMYVCGLICVWSQCLAVNDVPIFPSKT